MTSPQPHCEHECVCGQLCATRARQEGKPCEPGYSHWEGCNYDTRSRPAPAAPRIGKLSDAELDEIAEESYRQITGNQPPTAPDIKADKGGE